MAQLSKVFFPYDPLPAQDLNDMVGFMNGVADGTNLEDGAVTAPKLAQSAVGAGNIAPSAISIGYAQSTSTFSTTSSSAVQVTNLSAAVTIPSGGRRIRITVHAYNAYQTASGGAFDVSIWDGNVGSGTQLNMSRMDNASNANSGATVMAIVTPPTGDKTYSVGLKAGAGTAYLEASAVAPAFILVEAI